MKKWPFKKDIIMPTNHDSNNLYFIEKPADLDLIGFESYIESLHIAIENGAKFIGLISDFGSGKSTIINMLKRDFNNIYHVVNINLWDCNSTDNIDNQFYIHKNFLYQLIDNLPLENKSYFKKKINKNYSFIDIQLFKKKTYHFYISIILVILFIFDKVNIIELFSPKLKIWGYINIVLNPKSWTDILYYWFKDCNL